MKHIFISVGDYSADIHGEALVKAFRSLDHSIHVTALGGTRLQGVSDTFLYNLVQLDISGVTKPIWQFFNLKKILQNDVFPKLDMRAFDAVILIDYYGFNIHIARRAKKNGIPVYYFVSPQVWASRSGRIQSLKASVTKMLVIFPFEETLYKSKGVPVEFVGHPLLDRLGTLPKSAGSTESTAVCRLGLMPGSRPREVREHMPILMGTLKRLKNQFPHIEAVLFMADSVPDDLINFWLKNPPCPIQKVRNPEDQVRQQVSLCLTASGTAALENALLGIPMIVYYRASYLTYWIARMLIQIPYVSMPNILAGKEIVPELLQMNATPEKIAERTAYFLSHPDSIATMKQEFSNIKQQLGTPGAYDRTAQSILKDLNPLPSRDPV